MKHHDFISKLIALRVEVENATAYLKLYYKGKQTTCPRSNKFAKLIKRQLEL